MNYKNITILRFSNYKSNISSKAMNIESSFFCKKDSSGIIQSIRNIEDTKEIGRLKRMLSCATMSGIFRE